MSEWARQVPLSSYAKGGILSHFCIMALPWTTTGLPQKVHEARRSALTFPSNQARFSSLSY